jgi:cold shock CspA family protein
METVKWFNPAKALASSSRIVAARTPLGEGQKIEFDLVSDQPSGRESAENLKTVG